MMGRLQNELGKGGSVGIGTESLTVRVLVD